jgi:hypothetical protein
MQKPHAINRIHRLKRVMESVAPLSFVGLDGFWWSSKSRIALWRGYCKRLKRVRLIATPHLSIVPFDLETPFMVVVEGFNVSLEDFYVLNESSIACLGYEC